MEKIVFICTGNTCRSPMAEGIFRALDGESKTDLIPDSAGIFTVNGIPVSENAQKAASAYGADISNHVSKVITEDIVNDAKYLVCMTESHYDRLLEQFPDAEEKIFTLSNEDIDDPFGGNLSTYLECAKQIKQGVEKIIERLSKNEYHTNE